MAAIYHAVCDGRDISRGVRRTSHGVRQTDSEITWVGWLRYITQCVTAAIYHMVCDGRELSRGVRWMDSEITRV